MNMKNVLISFVLNQKLPILLLKIDLSLTYISRIMQEYDSSTRVNVRREYRKIFRLERYVNVQRRQTLDSGKVFS